MIAINILILLLLISFPLHNLLSEQAGELRVHFCQCWRRNIAQKCGTNVIPARDKPQCPSLGFCCVHSASARWGLSLRLRQCREIQGCSAWRSAKCNQKFPWALEVSNCLSCNQARLSQEETAGKVLRVDAGGWWREGRKLLPSTTAKKRVSSLPYLLFISLMRLFPGSLITIIRTIPFSTLFTSWKRKSLWKGKGKNIVPPSGGGSEQGERSTSLWRVASSPVRWGCAGSPWPWGAPGAPPSTQPEACGSRSGNAALQVLLQKN